MAYRTLAYYYDTLMVHVDYEEWVDFVLSIGRPSPIEEGSESRAPVILDLACGTGNITTSLVSRGYRVIGIDRSRDMLAVARNKVETILQAEAGHEGASKAASIATTMEDFHRGAPVALIESDMTDFKLGMSVDAVYCLTDSLNYLIEDGHLLETFQCVASHLKPTAPFVFDVHTRHRFQDYAESIFAGDEGEVAYIWESDFDELRGVCSMHVSLFIQKNGGPFYERIDEVHLERAYSDDEIHDALTQAGLSVQAKYGDLTPFPPSDEEGRIFYVASALTAKVPS